MVLGMESWGQTGPWPLGLTTSKWPSPGRHQIFNPRRKHLHPANTSHSCRNESLVHSFIMGGETTYWGSESGETQRQVGLESGLNRDSSITTSVARKQTENKAPTKCLVALEIHLDIFSLSMHRRPCVGMGPWNRGPGWRRATTGGLRGLLWGWGVRGENPVPRGLAGPHGCPLGVGQREDTPER